MNSKIILITWMILLIPLVLVSQSERWVLNLNYSLQEHDKRLFDLPVGPATRVLEKHPEFFGTHQFGVSISKILSRNQSFKIFAGGGISLELATFERPFDHNYPMRGGTKILLWTDRYYHFLAQFPLQGSYNLSSSFSFVLNILPHITVHTIAEEYVRNYSWWRFDFYSVEVNPGIEFNMSNFLLSLKYRAFQVKKVDPIIFHGRIKDSRDHTYETFNPFKLWVSLGYAF